MRECWRAMLTPEIVQAAAARAGLASPSIVIRQLEPRVSPDRAIELDAHRAVYPASMIKLPIACAIYTLVERGLLDPQSTVEVTASNMTLNDKPSPFVPGYHARIAELVEFMLTRSDNVATNCLIDVGDRRRINDLVAEMGSRSTRINRKLSGSDPRIADPQSLGENSHPAADFALLAEQLHFGRLPYARLLKEILFKQEWNDRLSRGLHQGDRFAHKTGDTSTVCHDGGILHLDSGQTLIVVVYTECPEDASNAKRFGDFATAIRPHLSPSTSSG
ncbi:MAG: hypothetical protein NVSMB31_02980 [Vulcanimicrobiaceae bacterium]